MAVEQTGLTDWEPRMRRFILMLLLAVASGSAAAEWVLIGRADSFDSYADPASIEALSKFWGMRFSMVGNDVFEIRQLTSFSVAQHADGVWIGPPGPPQEWNRYYSSLKSTVSYDCQAKEYRLLRQELYTEQMGGGRLVGQRWWSTKARSKNHAEWKPVPSGTIAEEFLKFVCGKK